MADTLKRVKLYTLDVDKILWIDKGTGRIISTISDDKQYFLKVFSEVDEHLLLDMKILSDVSFEKQQETLILWCDRDDKEFALSFQDKEGCEAIWRVICCAQDRDCSTNVSKELVIYESDDQIDVAVNTLVMQDLPPIEVNCLQDIIEFMNKFKTAVNLEKLSCMLLRGNYVVRLLDMFQLCETQHNQEALSILCDIFKRIVTLSNAAIFEKIFKKERIFDVVGCFEYDKSVSFPRQHREFLKQNAKYNEVSSSLSPELLDKIHQTYRVQYIQDVILPSINALEESILLSPFLYRNKVLIVTMIQDDMLFLSELFELLMKRNTEVLKHKNIVFFLKELFMFALNLQSSARNSFYKVLIDLKIIPALESSFQVNNEAIKLAVIEIFHSLVEYSPTLVRKYMLEQTNMLTENIPLIILLVNGIINESESECGCALHLLALFKLLLHPDNMETALIKSDKTDFLNYFYTNALDLIIDPILASSEEKSYSDEKSLVTILELLEFCVEHHSYHIRNVILHKDLLRHILQLMNSPQKFLSISAIRFTKKVIALKDEFYNRYIIAGDLLAPVVEAFLKNEGRYNMLDSAILDLFELIRMEEIKSLCSYVMEHFGKVLDNVKYVQTFKCLKHAYEQNCVRNREKNVPMYLQNCFKSAEDEWCFSINYKIAEEEVEEKCAIPNISVGDFHCVKLNLEVQEKENMKKMNNTPRLQSIIGDQSPIFRRVSHLAQSKVPFGDLNVENSKKRLVEYDADEEDEDSEREGTTLRKKIIPFGRCKRVCLH